MKTIREKWRFRIICIWIGLCLTLVLNLLTHFISEPGEWYSDRTALRRQTDAFFGGHIALASDPYRLDWDMVWDHGIQQVWGLGVPAFRFIFELLAKAFGFAAFPDRITFLIACFLCFAFLIGTFANQGDTDRAKDLGNWKLVQIACILALMIFAPPFLALMSTRFEFYEEVVAYGYLYTMVLFSYLLRVAQRPTVPNLLLISIWAGLGTFIRPTLLFYGFVTLALALVIGWRARVRLRVILGMLLLFGLCGALLGFSNQYRFGAFGEFGHTLNITHLNHNAFSLKFDYPFHHEPILSASMDELGSLFFVQKLNGNDYYRQGGILGQSATYRWHEMCFTTFNSLYLCLLAASGLLWLLNYKRIRAIWSQFATRLASRSESVTRQFDSAYTLLAVPWSAGSFACLYGFYLWSPSMASRYNVDFLPAVMTGITGLIWNVFEFNLVRRNKIWVLIGCSVTLLWLAFSILNIEISPDYKKRNSLDWLSVERRMAAPSYTTLLPVVTHYEQGTTKLQPEIPFNGEGWNRTNGQVEPVVTLFVSNPESVVMSLHAAPGAAVNHAELASIQAKIGLEYLARESEEIHSNKATLVFRGPKKSRYQTGLQVCFLGFINPQDLGRKDPSLLLDGVSFVRPESAIIDQAQVAADASQ